MIKFSIIIATYNAERLIEKTLLSILNQTYRSFELLIIDGGSTDRTLDILKKYDDNIEYRITEKDNGIYDAWNKGLLRSKNEWILFIGAGDELSSKCLENYTNYISTNKNLDFISSRINLVNLNGSVFRTVGKEWRWNEFSKYMTVTHVASLHHRSYFDTYGYFDIKYKIVGDYELLLRSKQNLRAGFLNVVQANMLIGGISAKRASIIEAFFAKIKTGSRNVFLCSYELVKAELIRNYRNIFYKF